MHTRTVALLAKTTACLCAPLFLIAACGEDGNEGPQAPTNESAEPEAAPTPEVVSTAEFTTPATDDYGALLDDGTSIRWKAAKGRADCDPKLTVSDYPSDPALEGREGETLKPPSGKRYCVITVEYTNLDKVPAPFEPGFVNVVASNGSQYSVQENLYDTVDPQSVYEDQEAIQPGDSIDSYSVFELPADTEPEAVQIEAELNQVTLRVEPA